MGMADVLDVLVANGIALLLMLQRANYEDAIQLDGSWEKAHFSYAVYLDSLYMDAKQREVNPHCPHVASCKQVVTAVLPLSLAPAGRGADGVDAWLDLVHDVVKDFECWLRLLR
jgi:hypothetical protein